MCTLTRPNEGAAVTQDRYIELGSFMREAEVIAGSDDWGDEDFREPLERFVSSLNGEAELTPLGVRRTHSHLRKLMVGRLGIFRDRKVYEGIAGEEVKHPLVITGLGRSGTSYLNALLASDPGNYAPLHWQIWSPSPPPSLPDVDHRPAMEAGERYIQFEGWQEPDVRKTHDYSSDNPAEDILIQEYSFRSGTFGTFWNVPSFIQWQASIDPAPAYRIERKVLQALQFGGKRDQWVVKAPRHLGQLPALLAEFADARIVVNHRDPVKCLGSITNMFSAHRRQFGNAPTPLDRGYALARVETYARNLGDMMERRRDPEVDRRCVDVQYLDLEGDPLGQVARIYERHGITFTEAARDLMQRHIAENRKGKFGAHRYDVRDTGVRIEEVRERLKFYTDHFNVPLEA
jgi:hypothetical protein